MSATRLLSSKVLFLDTDALPAFETRAADLVQNDVEVQLIRQVRMHRTRIVNLALSLRHRCATP